eukprot:scaffold9941_cov116-Isochrysis_galbana.AAC.2
MHASSQASIDGRRRLRPTGAAGLSGGHEAQPRRCTGVQRPTKSHRGDECDGAGPRGRKRPP